MPEELIRRNREWSERIHSKSPEYFPSLAALQKPDYFWIGCADARVPANVIAGLEPGEVFVHRNVANVVLQTDLNAMSVVDFAVHTLQVRHIIVCGHYGCGGVMAAMGNATEGVVDHWLSGIRDLWRQHQGQLANLDEATAQRRLCELNVRHQVKSLCQTSVIKRAWERGQAVDVHGWIYDIDDGLLRDLGVRIACVEDLTAST